jgi:photosystem II protein PsbQ
MLKAIRRLAAFCLCISLCWGLMIPASSEAASSKPDDLSVLKRQAEAFTNTKARLPELARLVSNEDWTFTRNLIHGPMQEVGREMLFINKSLDRTERKNADKLARSLKTPWQALMKQPACRMPVRCRRPTAIWLQVLMPIPMSFRLRH